MVTPLAYFDLVETLPKPGCAICNLVLRDVEHFLDLLLYERVTEPETHLAFRARRGLCNEHSTQLVQLRGGAVGTAVLYRAALNEVLAIIEQTPAKSAGHTGLGRFLGTSSDGRAVADRLEPTGPCVACQELTNYEQRYAKALSQYIADTALLEAYQGSDGLCLPHFRQVVREVGNSSHLRDFVAMQVTIWEDLREQLTEFIDKNDHRRSHEAMGAEGDSWRRAAFRLAGERGVFGVDPR